MANSLGQILACRHAAGVWFRVVGRATAALCPEFRQFADESFAAGAARVRVDLRDCTHFDSTFLGTLLYFRRRSHEQDNLDFALLAPSDQCQQLLRRMVVTALFSVAQDGDDVANWDEWTLLSDEQSPNYGFDFKRNVVDAHQELVFVGGMVAERFKPLAEAVAREFEAEQARNKTC